MFCIREGSYSGHSASRSGLYKAWIIPAHINRVEVDQRWCRQYTVALACLDAAAAAASAVLGERGMTAVHSRILEWHTVDGAAGCTGHWMVVVVVLKRGGWHMSWREQCMERVLHDAEGGAAAADGGCSGSS